MGQYVNVVGFLFSYGINIYSSRYLYSTDPVLFLKLRN